MIMKKKKKIVEHARTTRIIIHEAIQGLIHDFLDHKRKWGTKKEKEIYQDLDYPKMIKRLIFKRALTFFGGNDFTILLDGSLPDPTHWNLVGTDQEGEITIKENLTYDEMALSALIGVSVPTFFINSGGRYNGGNLSPSWENEGVYVALTGARFERRDQMESKHMLVTQQHHTKEAGYGNNADPNNPNTQLLKVWFKFYSKLSNTSHFVDFSTFPTFEEAEKYCQNHQNEKDLLFHAYHPPRHQGPPLFIIIPFYKTRLQLILEPFLLEANDRAAEVHKKAYIHAVGLGLGVWQISNLQPQWMLDVFETVVQNNVLPHVSDIDFSWFPDDIVQCGKAGNGEKLTSHNGNSITIHFSKRDPAAKLDDEGKLLVAAYAWDGNSFPGNEYWRGMLHASGDPAAACCSTIAELQNPFINDKFVDKIKYWKTNAPPPLHPHL